MKKITVSILSVLMMLSMVFSSSVFAANEQTSAWESFKGLFGVKATETSDVGVEYRGHVENKGDFPVDGTWIQGPERLGTVGEGLRLEAFWIKLAEDAPAGLHIKYQVHVQNKGWMGFVNDGAMAGTEGEGLRIEAIQISLVDDEGDIAQGYSVEYRGHVQNIGDTEWYTDGAQLGTTGSGLRLEALEIKIVQTKADMTAYEAALAAVTEADYTKASWAAYQEVVEANVVTEDNSQAEVDAATEAIVDAQEDLVEVPVIAGMSATAQKTITVTGTDLSKLSASMFTVANNTVTGVAASADGTSAVLTLGTDLVPEANTKVTTSIDGTASEYTVKYSIVAVTVAIQEVTYDNDLDDQSLVVLVDGVVTTVDYLKTAGYTVAFNVWNSSNNNVTAAFLTAADSSAIKNPVTEGDYTAQVTLTKASVISTSAKSVVKVRNLNNNASDITSYELTNDTTGAVLKSTTLFTTETAHFSKVVVGYGDAAAELLPGSFDVTSSNTSVISVNSSKVMSAVGLGTADLTITVGNASKVVTLTVVGTQRVATVVTPASNPFAFVMGTSVPPAARDLTVTVTDQYGDPFVGTTNIGATIPTSITGLAATASAGSLTNLTTDTKGQVKLALASTTAKAGETGVLVFRNNKSELVGSCNITTTTQNVITDTNLVRTAGSTDTTLNDELTSDRFIEYKVSNYASDGSYLGDVADLTDYTVTYNPDIVTLTTNGTSPYFTTVTPGTVKLTTAGTPTRMTFTAKKAGSTPITVKDPTGEVVDTVTVVVVKGQPYMTGITFKTTSTINYIGKINHETAFNLNTTSGDPIVNGVTLSAASVYNVRMTKADATTGEILYLDTNADGNYTVGTDIPLGTVKITVTNDTLASTMSTTGAVVTGVTTDAGSKGNVTFTVTDTVSSTPVVIGTKAVVVNVPAAVTGVTMGSATSTVSGVAAATQVSTIKITAPATVSSDLTIDGTTVAVIAGDTAADVATKIIAEATTATNSFTLSAGADDTTVVFTAAGPAANVNPIVVVAGTTGVTFGGQTDTTVGKVAVAAESTVTVTNGAVNAGTIVVRVADGTITKDVAVLVAAGDSDAAVAGKIQAALAADPTISAEYIVTDAAEVVTFEQQPGEEAPVTLTVTLV